MGEQPLEGIPRDMEEESIMENPGLENVEDPDLEDEGLAADSFMENQGTEDVDMVPEEELHNNEEFADFVQEGELSHADEPINQHVIPGAEFSSEVFDEESDPHNEPVEVVDPESNDLQTAEELEEMEEKSYGINSGRPLMQAPWSSEVVDDEEYEEYSDYEEGEDEEMYEDENYSYGTYQDDEGVSPPKKAREQVNEVEEEVILDSDDDDDNVETNKPSEQVGEAARWQHHMRSQQDNSTSLRQQTAMRGPPYQVDSQLMAHQLLLQQQAAARVGGYPGLARGTQVFPQEVPGQKRKHRPSMAICIKDGRVYMKPFTDLPVALTSNLNTNRSQQMAATKPVETSHLYQNNQYKQQEQQRPMFGAQLTVQQMSLVHQQRELVRQQVRDKQEVQLGSTLQTSLQDRLRNLPAGLQVQQSGGTRQPVYEEVVDDENSLDNDEDNSDLYNSDDPEEEIIREVDTSVEQVDSSSVVEEMGVNENEEYNEEVIEEDDHLEEGQEEAIGTEETFNDIDHSEPVELCETQEPITGDVLAFEQSSKDIQEACEENDAGWTEENRETEVEGTEDDPVSSTEDKEESQEDSPVKNSSASEETM